MSAHAIPSLSFWKIFQQKNLSGIHVPTHRYVKVAKPAGERGTGIDTDGLLTVLLIKLGALRCGFRARVSTETLHGMTGEDA